MLETIKGAAGGMRLALVLFAFMALLAWRRPANAGWSHWLREVGWLLILISIVSYSPAHAVWLLGRPLPKIWSSSLDLVASAAASAAIIVRIAATGLQRGLSAARVRNGVAMNIAILLALEVAAWLLR